MGLEFQVGDDKVCYTPLKDKCEAIRNLDSPKTLKQMRAFCSMVNFLSSFLPDLRRLLIPIYDIQKKSKKFKSTDEAGKAFNDIKKLLVNPPVLKAPAFGGYHLLLVITCDQTNFTVAVPLRDQQTQTIAEALIYRVIYLFSPSRWIVCDEAAEFTSAIIQAILTMLNCRLKVISPYNHGSSKCERQIKMISDIIVKHLWDKGQMWPLFATTVAYAMNTFASEALSSFSPFQLVFL